MDTPMGGNALGEGSTVTVFQVSIKRSWHKWLTKNKALAVITCPLIIACIVVVAVVPPLCILKGCPARDGGKPEPDEVNRLIVTFQDLKSTVKSKIPSILYEYLEEVSLSSGINVVSFRDPLVLAEVRKLLEAMTDLGILIRDRPLYRVPQREPREAVLTRLPGDAGRRLQQAASADGGGDALASRQWANDRVLAQQAWNVSEGAHVVVAVIDTGCHLTHPDLQDHLWVNPNELAKNGQDDDHNGWVDDVHGYDFAGPCENDYPDNNGCGPKPNPDDEDGHGSHCSGIIGAVRNNGVGIAGIAPSVRIMCLKTVPRNSKFYLSHVLKAINYAVSNGAHVISCSFGPERPNANPTPYELEEMRNETELYKAALQEVVKKNMLLVAAAGNENFNLDELVPINSTYNPCTMARYFPDHVLCVMATDELDQRLVINLQGTNYGKSSVGIAAPGYQIISTVPPIARYENEQWANKTGSSMATPLVAGIGALIMSVLGYSDSNFCKGKEARNILTESADVVGGLPVKGGKRVNAKAAVQTAYYKLAGVIELSPLTSFSVGNQTVMTLGFSEAYYDGSLHPEAVDLDTVPIRDETTRVTSISVFRTYKYGYGTTVVVKALLCLKKPGLYKFMVSSDASHEDVSVLVGQKKLANLNFAYVLRSSGGWFTFELWYRNPQKAISITMSEPDGEGDLQMQHLSYFYLATSTRPQRLYHAPDIVLSSVYQILTKPAVGPIQGSTILPSALQLDLPYNNSAVINDVAFNTSMALREALYGKRTDMPSSIVGLAHTRLVAPSVPMRFKVTCDVCGLYVNDLKVLDVYDPTGILGAATQLSNCVAFNGNTSLVHELTLRFAVYSLHDAPLVISWQPCNANDNGDGAYSVTTHTVSSVFWRPSSGVAAYVPGLQCDVWPYNETEGWPPRGAPLLKFRFPAALMQTQRGVDRQLDLSNSVYGNSYKPMYDSGCSANETASQACKSVMSIVLRDVFSRGERRSASTLVSNVNMRCWTYVNYGLRNGTIQARYSTNRDTTAYLGSQMVFQSATSAQRFRHASIAPNATTLNGYYQLLALEWMKYPFETLMEVFSGPTEPDLLAVDMSQTLLPIPVVAPPPPAISTTAPSSNSSSSSSDGGGKPQTSAAGVGHHHHRRMALRTTSAGVDASAGTPLLYDSHGHGHQQHHHRNRRLQGADTGSRVGRLALGASAYSLSDIPGEPRLLATVYTPDATYNAVLGFLNSTVLSNLALNGIIPASTTCQASTGLYGNVCNLTSGSPGPRFVRVRGFMRVPGAGNGKGTLAGGLAIWALRVKDGVQGQATAITFGDVTVRNAVEFPASVLESETVLVLPRVGPDLYIPTVVMARSNRTDVQARFEVMLVSLSSPRTELKVDMSMWYGVS